MRLDQGAADRQADAATAAARLAAPGGVGLVEPFEDVREVLGGDPVTGVGDVQLHPVVVGSGRRELNGATGRGVPQCVLEQVRQDLPHALGVDVDVRERTGRRSTTSRTCPAS